MPKLSIIIPTYNSAATMERCLNSIRVQTFTDYEILIQEDGSSDRTVELIKEFQRQNPEIDLKLNLEEHAGAYGEMNNGMAKARGEWLYFLGSDDELFDPTALGAALSRTNTSGCNVIYGNVQSVGDGVWGKSGTIYDGKFSSEKLLNRNICHQAIFYRAEFARQIGEYNTDYRVLADWDFNLRCWARTKFKYLNITVAKFHLGGFSNTGKRDDAFFRDFTGNVMRYFDLPLLSPLLNSTGFCGVYDVIGMQQAKGPIYSFGGKVVRRLLRLRPNLGIG